MTRRGFTSALAFAATLALVGCQGKAQRPPCPAGKVCLEYGANAEPSTLDPQTATGVEELRLIGDLMMGLVTDGPDAAPVPGMAERWETSADGLTWTFHLRPALWSDGRPVTADDFVFAYRRILDPRTAATNAYLVEILKNGRQVSEGVAAPEALGAEALDARTLRLTLEHPAPYLPQLLKHQSFYPVPAHAVRAYGDGWTAPGRYVSNGPFRLVAWNLGDKVTVEKNPRFFDAARVCLDRINYYPTSDAVGAERRVKSGELDLNTAFQSNRIERLRRRMGPYVHTHVALATTYLSLNRSIPALRDPRVRRALSESVDRTFISAKLMRAGQAPAYSFVPPVVAGYPSGPKLAWASRPFTERQAEARRLLAAAGFGPDHPLRLELKGSNGSETVLLMEAVQADWRAVGVDVRVVQNEGAVSFAAFRNRDFEVGAMNWYADFNDPVSFLGVLRSDTGAQNYGDYRNPAYDALLDAADREADAVRRAAILARAEQLMLDDEAIIPIFFIVNRSLVSPRVTGWVDNAENYHRARWLCARR